MFIACIGLLFEDEDHEDNRSYHGEHHRVDQLEVLLLDIHFINCFCDSFKTNVIYCHGTGGDYKCKGIKNLCYIPFFSVPG